MTAASQPSVRMESIPGVGILALPDPRDKARWSGIMEYPTRAIGITESFTDLEPSFIREAAVMKAHGWRANGKGGLRIRSSG